MNLLSAGRSFSLRVWPRVVVLITLLFVPAAGFLALRAEKAVWRESLQSELLIEGERVISQLQQSIPFDADRNTVNASCKNAESWSGFSITLFDKNGTMLCDSPLQDCGGRLDAYRPAGLRNIQRWIDSWSRRSGTLEGDCLYIALAFQTSNRAGGLLRKARPIRDGGAFSPGMGRIALGGLVLAGVLGLISFFFMRAVAAPLEEMAQKAEGFAQRQGRMIPASYRVEEVERLASAMNKMGEQFRHLEEVRRDFVANVSHELKTPITSIKGFVETLLEGACDDSENREWFLRIISRQSDRLVAIIEDLLILARLESGKVQDLLDIKEHRLLSIIMTVVDDCRARAKEKDILIEHDCPTTLRLHVDRALLEQGLINLVDNAIKYSNPYSEVRISALPFDGQMVISVRDEGPGISAEHLPRLFERFYRVDKARSREMGGTGLGLAVVKHVATVHGGTVSVQSEIGKGSVFSIHLPKNGPRGEQL